MKLVDVDYALEHLPNDLPYKASVKSVFTQLPEVTMFDDVSFVEFCSDAGGAEDGFDFVVAIRGLNEVGLSNLECLVHAAVDTMIAHDSAEDKVQEILNDMGAEYKVIYPKHITI